MTDPSDQPAAAVQEAFEELARISLPDQSLDQVMMTIASLAQRIVPGADEVSVTFLEQGRASTVASTGRLATELDERQYERGYGPCLDGVTAGSVVEIPDMTAERRWPDWARAAAELGARASLTVPVPL